MAEGNSQDDSRITNLVKGAITIDQIQDKNDTPTMRDLSRYVIKKYASDWKSIGLELGLDNHLLKNIKSDNPLNCVACLQETLEKWMDLNTEGVTWETLELALTNVNRANLKLDPVDDLFGIEKDVSKSASSSLTETVSDKLIKNLRHDYKEDKHSLDVDEWPPNQPKTVVNVALIHHKGCRIEQEFIEIPKDHKGSTPAIDKLVTQSRVTQDISEIFKASTLEDNEAKPPKFILIEGAPGIGKTVLAKNIAYCWAEKKLLLDVKVLFLLFLRDPRLHNITKSEELIQYMSRSLNEEQAKNCVQQIIELQGGIIMDGLDECPTELCEHSLITKLIKGKIFHNSIVVLTSRPTATLKFHGNADRRVEILGFAQEERDKYIIESLDSPDEIKQLQGYFKRQPIINGLVYVPLHLAILLYLFKVQSILPETLTEMNKLFTLHTIYRSLAKEKLIPAGPVTNIRNIEDLPEPVVDIVEGLSKLAFIGLQNNQLVFSHDEVKENCPVITNNMPGTINGFGLLQVVQHFPKEGAGTTASFNFLHFTMQEFLAALYVSNITIYPYEKQVALIKQTFWSGKYTFMWMMYFGINGINSQALLQFLYKAKPKANTRHLKLSKHIMSDKTKCLHLFQCFMEAKSEQFPKKVSNFFHNNEVNFCGLQLLPHHISSITLYISKYSIKLQSLNLRDCHIGDVGMRILLQYFTVNSDAVLDIKHLDLFGNDSVLLWNVYCAVFGQQNLNKLDWSSLGGVKIEEIANVMNNNVTIQSLDLSDNHFEDDDALKIAEVLSNNITLQELNISNNNITTRGVIAFSQFLCDKIKFQYLEISWNDRILNANQSKITFLQNIINNVDAQMVAGILYSNELVTDLNLSQFKIFDNGTKNVSNCGKISSVILKQITTAVQKKKFDEALQIIDVSHNGISDDVAVAISECLMNNSVLQEIKTSVSSNGIKNIGKAIQMLDISHNFISDSGAVAIAECLKINYALQHLDISYNQISNAGIIIISKALQINQTLQILDISHNFIFDDGAISLGNSLRNHSMDNNTDSKNEEKHNADCRLKSLNLSYNNISSQGIIAISDCFKNNNTLQELTISWNDDKFFFMSNKIHGMSRLYFGDVGTILTIAFIFQKGVIQKLDISFNNISDYGAVAISEYLKASAKTLTELDVSNNNIGNEGIIGIVEAIQFNTALRSLDISYNNLCRCSEVVTVLGGHLKLNNTLQILKMSWNDSEITYIYTIETKCYLDNTSLQFSDTEAILLTALAHGNVDVKYFEIIMSEISDKAAMIISTFLKTNVLLQHLKLSQNTVSIKSVENIIVAIQTNTTLQTLDISSSNICDDGAAAISECLRCNNTLKKLNMSCNKVSDIGIINIAKALQINTALQILNISNNNISDNGAIAFGEALRGSMTTTNKAVNYDGDSQKYVLQSLNTLSSYTCSESTSIVTLNTYHRNSTALQTLVISWNTNGFRIVLNRVNTICDLSQMHLGNTGIILISQFYAPQSSVCLLDISHNNISDDGAVAISEYLRLSKTLQELHVSNNDITNKGIIEITQAIRVNTALRLMDLSHNKISRCKDVVRALSDCLKHNTTLKVLGISWNDNSDITYVYAVGISNTGICCLDTTWPHCYSIKHYVQEYDFEEFDHWLQYEWCFSNHVSGCKGQMFTDSEAILFTSLLYCSDDVATIEVVGHKVCDSAAITFSDFLMTNKTLEKLELAWNIISSEAIKQIMKALQANTILQTLDVSYNNISDDGAVAISKYLQNNDTLKELNVSHNKVSDSGIINIGEALQSNTRLKILDISYNSISDYGVSVFSGYLKKKNNLYQLMISWNNIYLDLHFAVRSSYSLYQFGNTGAILISAFMYHNLNIAELIITYNNISDDGAIAISEYIKINNALQKFDISHNAVSNNGIINISKALQLNETLQILDISYNNVTDDGAIAISDFLKANNTLEKLNVSYNQISYVGIIKICGVLLANMILQLQVLDISHNNYNIFNDRAMAIDGTMSSHCKGNSLVITDDRIANNLSSDGFRALINYLKCSSALQKLTISLNDTSCVLDGTNKFLNMSNKHLENIGTILVLAFLFQNHTIRTLNLSHNAISDDGAVAISEYLRQNQNLEKLYIFDNNITNQGIIEIANGIQMSRSLRILDISRNDISRCTEVVTALRDCLKYSNVIQFLQISWKGADFIYVYSIEVNKFSVKYPLTLSWLKHHPTRVHYCDFKEDCLESDEYFNDYIKEKSLNQLRLSFTEAVLLTSLIYGNEDVKTIEILESDISDTAAMVISDFLKMNETVEELKFSQNRISSKGINQIMKAVQFNTALRILHNNVTADGVMAISECLQNNNSLQKLNISKSNSGIISISKALQMNASLQILNISHNNISNCGAVAISKYLRKNSSLQELNMSYNKVSNGGIINISKALKINKSLLILDISYNKISDDGTLAINECLKTNNTLQKLNISYNKISDTGIINIGKALETNTTLQVFDISHNNISVEGIFAFSENLKKKNTLHQLLISWNSTCVNLNFADKVFNMNRGYTGVILILSFLYCSIKTQELNISESKISDVGTVAISEYLKINNTLQKLDISANQISDVGIIDIVLKLELKINPTLQTLNISHNNISDGGAVAIGKYLKNDSMLQQLNMSHNKVSCNGIISISKALQINTTLRILDISHNIISNDGAIAIGESLSNYKDKSILITKNERKTNKDSQRCTLKKLDMSYNDISSKGILALSNCLKSNNKCTLQQFTVSWIDDDEETLFVFYSTNEFYNLSSSYFGNVGTIILSACLFQYDRIETLNISANAISDDGAAAISDYLREKKTLKELDLSSNFITCHGIIKIAKALKINAALRLLDVTHNDLCKCKEVVISLNDCLKHNSTLQVLGISWNNDEIVYYYAIGINNKCYVDNKQPYRKKLNNTVHYVREYRVEEFDQWSEFQWHFGHRNIQEYKNIKLQFSDTEAMLLTALAYGNINVKVLEIVNYEISDNGAKIVCDFLKGNNTLQKLNMSGNIISSEGMKLFMETIRTSTTLLTYDISYNNLCDNGVLAIIECLKHNGALEALNIAGNTITVKGAEIVAHFIQENANITENIQQFTVLQKLDISHNNICDDGAIAIGGCLKLNKTLEELNLSDNMISNYAIGIIADAVKSNTTLIELNISHNSISFNGAVAISECLKDNETLKALDLSWNRISGNGAISIAEAIKINTTLQKLNISHNNISKDAIVPFSSYLKYNSALQELIISRCDNNITYIYISATKCCMNKMWQYSKYHGNTQYFVHKYGLGLTNEPFFNLINSDIYESDLHLQFDEFEAILLTSFINDVNKVKGLEISKSKVSDEAGVVVSGFLKTDKILQQLKLSDNRISDKAIGLIMKAIQTNTNNNLQLLDISSNKMYGSVAVIIGEYLKCNTTLKVLDISKNCLAEGIKIIANSIQKNTTLQKLFICIYYDELVAITESLTRNNTLQEVSLSWDNTKRDVIPRFTSWDSAKTDDISKLAEAIKINTGLHTLDLSSQYFHDPVGSTMTLLNAVEHNHTIIRLVLPKNVSKNEAAIKLELDKINKERIKDNINLLVLDSTAT